MDNSGFEEKLLYIGRLAVGMGHPFRSDVIHQMGVGMTKTHFEKACNDLIPLKYSFFTDALIVANLGGKVSESVFTLIADIAKVVDCDKEELRMAAMVAKAVLIDDFDVLKNIYSTKENNWAGAFREHIPGSWIIAQRVKCGEVCYEIKNETSSHIVARPQGIFGWFSKAQEIHNSNVGFHGIDKLAEHGGFVKAGERIIDCKGNDNKYIKIPKNIFTDELSIEINKLVKKQEKSIFSPCNGTVYFIEDEQYIRSKKETRKWLSVYVTSCFDNYSDLCEWHSKE